MFFPIDILDILRNQRNVFNFFPVGHGLFYAGSIDYKKYAFVYDCGADISSGDSVDLTNQIKSLKEYLGDKALDFVVLSHLHYDHFCGLEKLFEQFEVEKLILPYLGGRFSRETLLSFVYLRAGYDFRSGRPSLFDLLDIMEKQQRIHYLEDSFHSEYYPCYDETYWHFNFFVKQYSKTKIDQLNKDIEIFLKKPPSYSNVSEAIANGRVAEIKKIYESIFGKGNVLNNTSIVLLHKPVSQNNLICLKTLAPFAETVCFNTNGETLLTGDCCFNKELASKLDIRYPLAILQVPHHGSAKNWKSIERNFPSIQYLNAVITCSIFRLHNLPNKYTLDQIPCDKCVVVNERNSFTYSIITNPEKLVEILVTFKLDK